MTVALAIPCRTDEPALGRTLEAAWRRLDDAGVGAAPTLVCLNGPDAASSPAWRDAERLAHAAARPVRLVDADAVPEPANGVTVLATPRVGKAIAWNVLRAHARAEVVVFLDADVELGPDAIGLLLRALAAAPDAVLASPKTSCAPRATAFERIMAVPYRIDFPNLSGQLYAARLARLPATMPEDLIEPERWLELVVGRDRIVREPAARVVVRLPGTLADFYRQRIRIEMGKVQLARDYPGLAARGNAQPRLRAALGALGPIDLVRLAVYLALRESAYAVAHRRYRQRRTAGVWVQAASTKQWSA
jgi:hypothetical protein